MLDRDGNHRVSAGDRITVTLVGCYLRTIDDRYDGSLTIDIVAPPPSLQRAGVLTFGQPFTVQAPGGTVSLQGSLGYDYAADRLSKKVHAASAAQPLIVHFVAAACFCTFALRRIRQRIHEEEIES